MKEELVAYLEAELDRAYRIQEIAGRARMGNALPICNQEIITLTQILKKVKALGGVNNAN